MKRLVQLLGFQQRRYISTRMSIDHLMGLKKSVTN